ncbi:MAG: AAA family ATPase [Anaerolineae bacterium]|nr:AAA family ATPase [Anaerolineae bacterium]
MLTYIVGPPIRRPQDFYGRSREVARFFEIVAGKQTQSVSVLGVRRSGKTSFLQHVSNQEVMSRYIPNPRDYVMIYIDMTSCRTPNDFYQKLLVKLETRLSGTRPFNLWQSPDGQISLYDIETILCQHPHRRVILLLDEFDQIHTGSFGENFLIELRAMTGVLDYELAIVTASYWDLYQLGTHIGLPPTSPFYNIFYPTPIHLTGFGYNEAESLIRQPAAQAGIFYSETEVANIYALSGSLPFFLQAVAARWFDEKLFSEPPTFNTILGKIVLELAPYFEQWWRQLNECEQWLLMEVAENDLRTANPCTTVAVTDARRRLLAYGLLEPGANGLVINGTIFASWIKKYGTVALEKLDVKPETINSVALRRKLIDLFNSEEVRTICFDLQINYDDLRGESRADKIRELILAMQARPDGLQRLLDVIRAERGEII